MPVNAVYVGRPTRWGNPFSVDATSVVVTVPTDTGAAGRHVRLRSEPSRELAVDLFTAYARTRLRTDRDWLAPLHGCDLACWCPVTCACHADVLLELANSVAMTSTQPTADDSK